MHRVLILLGSNQGFRYKNLLLAKYFIQRFIGEVVAVSDIYETEPWRVTGRQSAYLNQCLEIKTYKGVFQILNITQKIEKQLGRKCKKQNQSRTIDIDILFYDTIFLNNENLIIPHPRLHLRKFTLLPLSEIAANFLHPVFNQTVQKILENVQDTSEVKLYLSKISQKI